MGITPMYKVVQVGTGVAGTPDYITGYFDSEGGTPQQAATAWRAFLTGNSSDYTTPYLFESISSVDLVDPVTGNLVGIAPVSVGQAQFTNTGGLLPPANALGVNYRTGVYIGGREIRGRTYLSRFTEDYSDNGRPNASLLSAFQTRAAALVSSNTTRFVVWSRKSGQWAEVTQVAVSPKWYVLKSRRD